VQELGFPAGDDVDELRGITFLARMYHGEASPAQTSKMLAKSVFSCCVVKLIIPFRSAESSPAVSFLNQLSIVLPYCQEAHDRQPIDPNE
jgi:hypothetical protein